MIDAAKGNNEKRLPNSSASTPRPPVTAASSGSNRRRTALAAPVDDVVGLSIAYYGTAWRRDARSHTDTLTHNATVATDGRRRRDVPHPSVGTASLRDRHASHNSELFVPLKQNVNVSLSFYKLCTKL